MLNLSKKKRQAVAKELYEAVQCYSWETYLTDDLSFIGAIIYSDLNCGFISYNNIYLPFIFKGYKIKVLSYIEEFETLNSKYSYKI